jgi:hypothetical protein
MPLVLSKIIHRLIGVLHGRFEHIPQTFALLLGISENILGFGVTHCLHQGIDNHLRGHFTGGVATHAITDRKKAKFRVANDAIFVMITLSSDIRRTMS